MKKINNKYLLLLLSTLIVFSIHAQTNSTWEWLPNSPLDSRFDDVSFVNSDSGWVVNTRGQIWRTADGGQTWEHMLDQPITAFRSVVFMNSNKGWIGNLGTEEYAGATDPNVLYATSDGGNSWVAVDNISGPMPRGLCGMQVVNDSMIVATGRVRGPAFFMKSTDSGESWNSMDMNTLAAGLVDVHFFSPDTGMVVGLTNSNHGNSHGIILFTHDGGITWEERFVSSQDTEWCWKISFPSRKVGYVSLQKNWGSPINIIKTTDGGLTWQEKRFSNSHYYVQGIGFATETLGWIGGNSSQPVYTTMDGGDTWYAVNYLGSRMNRFQMLNDSLGYAVGRTVYKYSTTKTSVDVELAGLNTPSNYTLEQNFPNPVSASGRTYSGNSYNSVTQIQYHLPQDSFISIKVFDLLGKEIATLVNQNMPRGSHRIHFDVTQLTNGIYFYKMETGNSTLLRKMLVLR